MHRLLVSTLACLLAINASAAEGNQEILIRAESATLNQVTGVGLYEGKAELRQGPRQLTADRIRIQLKDGVPSIIEATGNLVTLIETDVLEARGKRLIYNVATQRIQIFENAYVNHHGRIFEGAELEYDLRTKQVDARGGENGRVKLVIPAEENVE
ncbi:MAG: lipopolysaccharide transport periplasmic protein LptA [Alcanivoracaceae bacterium]|nr:lipopolysaccharide transport periplasmic protein LptA [Alcanivoracaceae bacterium]